MKYEKGYRTTTPSLNAEEVSVQIPDNINVQDVQSELIFVKTALKMSLKENNLKIRRYSKRFPYKFLRPRYGETWLDFLIRWYYGLKYGFKDFFSVIDSLSKGIRYNDVDVSRRHKIKSRR